MSTSSNIETIRRRDKTMSVRPNIVHISIGDICNLRCSYCLPRQEAWSKGKKWVEGDVVDKDIDAEILDKITPALIDADWVYLTGGGEPLACKVFWDFIEGRRPSNGITSNINGTLLSQANVERLLSYPKKMNIGVSLNAATRDGYLKIVGKDVFEDVIKGCQLILDQRKSRIAQLQFWAQMTVTKRNIDQIVPFVYLGKAMGFDMVSINPAQFLAEYQWPLDPSFTSESEDIFRDPETTALFEEAIKQAQKMANILGIKLETHSSDSSWTGPCRELFDYIFIRRDGNSNSCCFKMLPTGNVLKHDTFDDLWNNPQRKSWREQVLNGQFPKPCQTSDCPYYKVAEARRVKGLPVVLAFPDEVAGMPFSACIEAIQVLSPTSDLVPLLIKNIGLMDWDIELGNEINVGAKLVLPDGEVIREFRALLSECVPSNGSIEISLPVDLSCATKESKLVVDMVSERNFWFADKGSSALHLTFGE